MTLCVAWIRQVNNTEELVFATDSMLTGGEKWDKGIKLFELSRKGCLLCFTGNTLRAYPLILNLISSIKFNSRLENPETDLLEILYYITDLFSNLIKSIVSEVPGEDLHTLRSEAKFIFGGWCWRSNSFRVWNLSYSEDVEGFLFEELSNDESKTRFYHFIGDAQNTDIEKEAFKKFKQLLFDKDKFDYKLDMEPLTILRHVALTPEVREVGGSLQIGKVYKSGRSEFFGILWPSSKGNPFFQGREYNKFTRPPVKYYDPDTLEIIEMDLPKTIKDIKEKWFGMDTEFVKSCYPEGELLEDLPENDKLKLKQILTRVSYEIYKQVLDEKGADE